MRGACHFSIRRAPAAPGGSPLGVWKEVGQDSIQFRSPVRPVVPLVKLFERHLAAFFAKEAADESRLDLRVVDRSGLNVERAASLLYPVEQFDHRRICLPIGGRLCRRVGKEALPTKN